MANSKPSKKYDVIVIGAGPGGYVCAIRCAQLGMSVGVVEKRESLGGTCLNIGCIPSKALLHASERFDESKNHFKDLGIDIPAPKVNLKNMMKHKTDVIDANTQGIEFLFKKNKIDWIKGAGKVTASDTVEVGKDSYQADNIIVATGSDVVALPNIEIDEKKIVSSTGALELKSVPKSMVVIGGGVIGLEMGAVWSRLGAKVTVVEFLDRILPGMDTDCAKEMKKILEKKGVEFKLSTKVTSAKTGKSNVALELEPAAGGKAEKKTADVLLVAVGRKAYTDKLGLADIGVEMDDRGRVKVGEFFDTNVDGIYAIGDVIAGPMLAHKAEEEGVVLAEMLAGQSGHIDYNLVPGVVYTYPEVASIGRTEEQLKADGIQYNAGKFPFMANGRARAMQATDGFVKILADSKTDKILGCHILGAEAGTLIHEVAAIMEFGGSAEDLARTCHAHPTLSEVVKEAALAVDKRQIHM
jgi:dihydrolipoamide dehydrogenase